MRILLVALLCGSSQLAAQSQPLGASPRGLIPDEPACSACSILLRPLVELQVLSADPAFYPPKVVRQDGKGRYWALSAWAADVVR